MLDARDLSIRPLTIGEVIDRAIALTLRHFRTLFAVTLAVELPAFAAYRLFALDLAGALTALAAHPARIPPGLGRLAGLWLLLTGALAFLQLCASSLAAVVVAPSLEGRPDPSSGAWRAMGRRAWPITSSAAAQILALVLAPALGALPGLLLAWRGSAAATRLVGLAGAAAGAGLALLVALLRLALGPAAAGVEGLAGPSALWRSARLMSPRRGAPLAERPGLRASVLLLATFLIALAVNGLVGLPRVALGLATGQASLAASLPLPVEIVLSLFEASANAAVQPFSLVALAVFYFDRRSRLEGLDLEIWADGIAAGRSAP